jgi:hypothetical protein
LFIPAAKLHGRISGIVVDEHRNNKVIDDFVFLEIEQETDVLILCILTTGSGVWLNAKETTVIVLDFYGRISDTQKCGVLNKLSSIFAKLENKLVNMNITCISSSDYTSRIFFKEVDSFTCLFATSIEVLQRLRFGELETVWNIAVSLTTFISNYTSSNLIDCNLQFDGVV